MRELVTGITVKIKKMRESKTTFRDGKSPKIGNTDSGRLIMKSNNTEKKKTP